MSVLIPADSQWSFQKTPAVNLTILAVVYLALVLRRSRVRHRLEYARILSWYLGLVILSSAGRFTQSWNPWNRPPLTTSSSGGSSM